MTEQQAAYLRVAAQLRQRIRERELLGGARLPSLVQISETYGVSDIVARQAVAVLRNEGLVETRRRAGVFVRERPPVRRIAFERYRDEAACTPADEPATSFTRDHDIAWADYHLEATYAEVAATDELAALLEIGPAEPLLRRRFVFYARGEATQISTNYLPLSMVADTPVADPDNEPWPGGTPAQLASLGYPVTRVEESVTARMPDPEEMDTLAMAPGVPVLAITRRMLSGNTVGEVAADIVIPADRAILDYAIDL